VHINVSVKRLSKYNVSDHVVGGDGHDVAVVVAAGHLSHKYIDYYSIIKCCGTSDMTKIRPKNA